MSKNKKKDSAAGRDTETDFVCPACQHTTGVKLGAPYMNGEQKLQLIRCVKCDHVMTELLSSTIDA